MSNLQKQMRELVQELLDNYSPGEMISLTLLGQTPLIYPYTKVMSGLEIGIKNEGLVDYLVEKRVLDLVERIPTKSGYPFRPTKFTVIYNKPKAIEFLDTISVGSFSLRIGTGEARFKNYKTKYKVGSQAYNLLKVFLENPYKRLGYEDLSKIIGPNLNLGNKAIQDLIHNEIKKRLGIPTKYFRADYGYTFWPDDEN